MAGFANDVVFATNVDFTGTLPVSGQITLDGEILIGATSAPFIRSGFLTGSGGVTITNGPGTINIDGSGVVTPLTFHTVGGNATPAANVITFSGTNGATLSGIGSTVNINLAAIPNSALANSSVTLSNGNNITVTGSPVSLGAAASFNLTGTTNHAVQVGNATGSLTSIAVGTNGQVIVGGTGVDPAFATLSSSDSSIAFTTGSNTLSLQVAGGTTVGKTITGDSGGALSPTLGNWNLLGSGSITTSGSGSTLTTQLTGLTNHALLVGAGTATITKVGPSSTSGQVLQSAGASADPAFSTATYPSTATGTGTFLRANGTNWVASSSTIPDTFAQGDLIYGSASNTLTALAKDTNSTRYLSNTGTSNNPAWAQVALTTGVIGTLPVGNGGTGATTLTSHGVLIGQSTSAVTATAAGSAGQILQSGGASADPTYSTATYPSTAGTSGKILISDGTNIISSTPNYPNAASTSGKVIVSDGTNFVTSTPTFPNASATSRKIIVSDGTNWLASTETWATPSTSGNVLTSDGTNWTSAAAPGGGVKTASVTLTSAQIKACRATPITLVAAPGSGSVIVPIVVTAKFNYAGTNVFTNGMNINLRYTNTTGQSVVNSAVIPAANIVAAASCYTIKNDISTNLIATTVASVDNQLICVANTGASEITGNAANDNTLTVQLQYYIITLA